MSLHCRMQVQCGLHVRQDTLKWRVWVARLQLAPNKPLHRRQLSPCCLYHPHPCLCTCKQKPHSLGVGGRGGGGGGAPCLLLLLLRPPLLPLLPGMGRKLLLQDVHLAREQVTFPFCYLTCRDCHCCLASRHLKVPSQALQFLLGLLHCSDGCCCCCCCCCGTHWVMSGCRAGCGRAWDMSPPGTFLSRTGLPGLRLLANAPNERLIQSPPLSPRASSPPGMVAHAQACIGQPIIIAWSLMPNGIEGQHTSSLENPPPRQ